MLNLTLATLWFPTISLWGGAVPERSLPEPSGVVQTFQGEGQATFEAGLAAFQRNDFETAIEFWQTALAQYTASGDQQQVVIVNNALAAASISLGRYQDAIAFAQTSADLAQRLANPGLEAQALGNLGIAYQSSGQYTQAVATYQRAIALLQNQPASAAIAQLFGLLGNTYEALGDYDSAIQTQETSLAVAREAQAPTQEATALMNLGGLHSITGRYSSAVDHYEAGIDLALAIENLGSAAYGLNNLGGTLQKQQAHQQALDRFQAALTLAQQTNNRALQASILTNIGVALEDLGRFDEALRHHQQSVQIAEALEDPRLLASVLNNLAQLHFVQGNFSLAESTVRESLNLLASLRDGLSDADKVNVFDTQIYTYNLLMQMQVAMGDYAAALETSELGRARAFVERVAGDGEQLVTPQIHELKQVARRLNATLVEYAIVPEDEFVAHGQQRGRAARIFVWVISPEGNLTFQDIALDNLDLADQVQQSRTELGALGRVRGLAVEAIAPSDQTDTLSDLYDYLIVPIEDVLPDNPEDLVVFIPHESLFYLPFAALQDTSGRPLIDRHTLLTAPAIQLLDLTLAPRTGATPLTSLVVGNPTMPSIAGTPPLQPLPGAEAEANTIAALFQTEAILGAAATESRVVARMAQADIIHLATHGLLDYVDTHDRVAVPGAIALAPSDTNDGLLTAREIADLSLAARLVVLSACDTGLGEVTGDGVVGLSRSLIAAGAQSTIVSLWAVPDEPTRMLMEAFYAEIWAGQNKAQALRQAMLQTKANHPDPLAWAAFVLIGNPEPL